MNTKKLLVVGVTALTAFATFAAPIVTDVTAKQRYPWNGKVDITCKVSGITSATKPFKFAVSAVNSGVVRNISRFWVGKDGKYPDEKDPVDHTVHANGTYHLVWDSKANFDKKICSNMVIRVNIVELDKVQLWADGPYWATRNIGATNPEDYGYYFWWGDTVGYKRVNDKWVASNGSSSNFSFSDANAPTWNKSFDTLQSEGWINGKLTPDRVLAPKHDAAHVHWGGAWRMPTLRELEGLVNNCDWTLMTLNGVKGCVVNGKGSYSSASIFLPCAYYDNGIDGDYADHPFGFYWSSVPLDSDTGFWGGSLHFAGYGGISPDTYLSKRYYGQPVRPVTD